MISSLPSLSELNFAYPWVFLLALALLIASRRSRYKKSLVLHPSVSTLVKVKKTWKAAYRKPILNLLWFSFIILLATAAAKPHISSTVSDDSPRRNLILALDVSGSMRTSDFGGSYGTVSRLAAVKEVVREFLKSRSEDRIGVVVFGNKAFLQSPLTTDIDLLDTLVSGLSVGVAGDGTAIGDGIGLSLKHINSVKSNSSSLILMTDGVNNAGQVNPEKAAKVAKQLGVKVHTIGIGNSSPVVQRFPGGIFSGQYMLGSEFDEALLKKISELTGGVYFNASSIEGLKEIYSEIDKLERDESKKDFGLIIKDYSWMFSSAALFFALLYSILANSIFLKVP